MQNKQAAAKPDVLTVITNLGLLFAALALGLVAFFSLMEILLFISAHVIVATNDSETRSRYALVTVRNFWLLGGGAVLVGLVIYWLDYFFKHWRERQIQRRYLQFVAAELVIIGLQMLIAG